MARPRGRLLVRALVCALIVVGLHVISGPATAAVDGDLRVATPDGPVMAGERVTLTGSLPPARARTVRLQRQTASGGWTLVESMRSRTDGTFRFTPAIPTTASAPVTYRVLAPAATLGGRRYAAVETPTVTLDVAPQTSSLHVPAQVLTGTMYSVEAVFAPARAGRSVVLQQQRPGGGWVNLATTTQGANGTAVFPRRLADPLGDVTLRARAQPYNGAAAGSTPVATVAVVPSGDVTPPDVPAGFGAIYDGGEAELSWDAVPDGDLSGYHVYRGSTQDGPWVALTAEPVATTSYLDISTDDPAGYWYTVTSTDVAGNESDRAAPLQPTKGDLTPPGAPTGLGAEFGDSQVELSWDAGPAEDLAGFQVYISGAADGPWDAVGEPVPTPSTTVTGLTNGLRYFFTVSGVDTAGNESIASAAVEATPRKPGALLAAGQGHTCRVADGGTLSCWGRNDRGQLGTGTTADSSDPVQVGSASNWWAVTAGARHSCGVRTNGTAWCWGDNGSGQLGAGTTSQQHQPVQVGSSTGWAQVAAGSAHTCGVRTDGTAWCWGDNGSGQLGDGTTTRRDAPAQVGTGTDWTVVTAGAEHTCGVRTDGTAWCWGANDDGQLGDGTLTRRTAPVQVGTATDWQSLTAAGTGTGTHTCGVRASGTAWCWGNNSQGQIGDGTTNDRNTPVQVGTGSDWVELTPGGSHTCGLRTNLLAWCWGDNYFGQVGDGTTADRTEPVQVSGAGEWAGMAAGALHTCGVLPDGGFQCWGSEYPGSPAPAARPVLGVDLDWSPAAPAVPDSDVVNPEEFGALGDGTTDDSAALQAALDQAAAVGASVELAPDTTYRLESQLLLPSGTYLHGAGSSSVLAFTWTQNDDFNDGMYLGNKGQKTGDRDITLDNFAILGAGNGEPSGPRSMQEFPNVPAIRFRLVDRFQISRLEISNAAGISLLNQGSSNGMIHDNYVHHSGRDGINTGWFRQGGHQILVANNLITKVGDDGIALLGSNGDGDSGGAEGWTHHVAAVGNTIQGWSTNINGLALGRGIAVLGVQDSDVIDNTVDTTHSNGILVGRAVDLIGVYRSSDVRFVRNVVANAGQLYPGSDPAIDEPLHAGVYGNRSDNITFVSTTVTNPLGPPTRVFDCTCSFN